MNEPLILKVSTTRHTSTSTVSRCRGLPERQKQWQCRKVYENK